MCEHYIGTGEGRLSPFSPAKTFFAVSSDIKFRALVVALPRCGKITQFFSILSGASFGSGSGVVTSSPAAIICPDLRAWYKSSWFTRTPRLVLTKMADGFIWRNASLLNSPLFPSFMEQQAITKSDCCKSVENGTNSALTSEAQGFSVFPQYRNLLTPKGCMRFATAKPIRPNPTIPTVLPVISFPQIYMPPAHVPQPPSWTAEKPGNI